jgi:hypothetical protein
VGEFHQLRKHSISRPEVPRMKYWFGLTCLSVTLLLSTPLARAQKGMSSVYSDLAAARCRTIEVDEEAGGSVQRCAGKGGYQLLVLDDDLNCTLD